MDQLKPYLILLKKHHFWVLSGLIPLVALITWWISAGKLDAETTQQKGAIEAKKATLQGKNASEYRPAAAEAAFNESKQKAHDNAYALWEALYNRQQNFMTWPDHLKDFPDKEKFSTEFRKPDIEQYGTYTFKDELKRVYDRLNLVRPRPGSVERRTTSSGRSTVVVDQIGLVELGDTVKSSLEARYLNLSAPLPTSHRIRAMQEDIWLLDNLAWVIAKTNEKSTDVANAAVKEILAMDVGRFAHASAPPPQTPATNDDGSAAGPTFTPDEWNLIGGRYLDEKSEPVTDYNRFAEFKQIPVKVKLKIDQRRIQEFLVHCANAPLMIEPRDIDIRPVASTAKGADARAAGFATNDVMLDFAGVTYIYRTPNTETLGKGGATPTGQRAITFPGAVVAEKAVATN